MSNLTLYQITDTIRQLQDYIESGEVDEEVIRDTLESWEGELEQKLENTYKYVKTLEAHAKAKEDEAKRLKEEAQRDKNHAEKLMKGMEMYLDMIGKREVKTPLFTFKFYKGREVVDIDESKLPDDYWQTYRKPISKTELKKLIESGKEIEGVQIVRNPDYLKVR